MSRLLEALKTKQPTQYNLFKNEASFNDIWGIESTIEGLVTEIKEPMEWSEEVLSYIPEINPHYIFPKIMDKFVSGIQEGDNVLLTGLQGSGKTSLVEQYCARTNRPFIRLNGSRDIDSNRFFGHVVLRDGNLFWEDGLFTKAMRYGAVFLYDEGFSGPPEINIILHPVMEYGGKLILADKPDSEKVVPRHPDFRMVWCDNTKGMGDTQGLFSGTSIQNVATLDRFGTYLHLDYPEPKAEQGILCSMGFPIKLAEKLVQLAGLLRTGFKQGQIGIPFSTRVLINLAKKSTIYNDTLEAFKISYSNRLQSASEEMAAAQIFHTVFPK
jgi:cobaltochelatase CobS